ncbi:MAG TPA: elongation factor P [Candidatus Dojkabacteria bacterium]|nr:elongation factor P [Candidatus Dojkabacteria bacterium]HQG58139.1 elongation factor P [Candidatus Dojkabacteria bacterium]
MALTNQFSKDMYIMFNDQIHHILDRQLKTQGRQGGLIILRLRNLGTGNVFSHTIKSGTKLEEVDMETKELQYLYKDGQGYNFMDTTTFDTVSISEDIIGDYGKLLKEGDKLLGLSNEGKVLNIKRNPSVTLEVVEAQDAVKGNTATNAMKEVTTETGLKIMVPLFIKKGDKISINTENISYTGRIN